MAFLTETDYNVQIRTYLKNVIIANDSDALMLAENMAQEEMCSYLAAKYDCDAIFAASGTDRNNLIIMYMVDIALYHLFSSITPNDIPQIRMDRYDRAVQWLKDVAKDLLNPNLPLLDVDVPSGILSLGGETKVTEPW